MLRRSIARLAAAALPAAVQVVDGKAVPIAAAAEPAAHTDSSPAAYEPWRTQPGLVFPIGQPGSWDDANLSSYTVGRFSWVGSRYMMWYAATSSPARQQQSSIGVAASDDGVHWARGKGNVSADPAAASQKQPLDLTSTGQIIMHGLHSTREGAGHAITENPLLNFDVSLGIIVRVPVENTAHTLFMGHISGCSQQDKPGGATKQIEMGTMVSFDGRTFFIVTDAQNEVLSEVRRPASLPNTSAEGPRLEVQALQDPDGNRVYSHSNKDGRSVISLSLYNTDQSELVDQGCIFEGGQGPDCEHDANGAASPFVLAISAPDEQGGRVASHKWVMFYEAIAADNTHSIGLAISDDGISGWRRLERPLLKPSGRKGAWDGGGVGKPRLVDTGDGDLRLYYAGRSRRADKSADLVEDAWEGYGLAVSHWKHNLNLSEESCDDLLYDFVRLRSEHCKRVDWGESDYCLVSVAYDPNSPAGKAIRSSEAGLAAIENSLKVFKA